MKPIEALALLQKHLPPEVVSDVLETLNLPPVRKPNDYFSRQLRFTQHVEATIPFHFQVWADSSAEAVQIVQMLLTKNGIHVYDAHDEVEGKMEGDLVITNTFEMHDMTEGDDPFKDIYDL